VVVYVEALAAACISLLAFLKSGWAVDDFLASRMTDADWVHVGCLRFLGWFLVGAALACVVWLVNRRLGLATELGVASGMAVLTALFIWLASGIGAAMFVIERPYF